jgi:hypothetical protein
MSSCDIGMARSGTQFSGPISREYLSICSCARLAASVSAGGLMPRATCSARAPRHTASALRGEGGFGLPSGRNLPFRGFILP